MTLTVAQAAVATMYVFLDGNAVTAAAGALITDYIGGAQWAPGSTAKPVLPYDLNSIVDRVVDAVLDTIGQFVARESVV